MEHRILDKLSDFPSKIVLLQQHQNEIIQLAKDSTPREICGLIAGKDNLSEKVFPITNIENSPTSFRMAPKEQLEALLDIEKNNLDLLAIFHSHPNGPHHPSPTDILKSNYPNKPNIIISCINDHWDIYAFIIANGTYQAIKIMTIDP